MQPNKYFFKKIFSHHYLEIKSKGPSHSSSGAFGSLLPFLSRRKTCPVFVKWDVILRKQKGISDSPGVWSFFSPSSFWGKAEFWEGKTGEGKESHGETAAGMAGAHGAKCTGRGSPFSRQSQWRHNPVRMELDSSSLGPPWPAAWVHEQSGNSPTLSVSYKLPGYSWGWLSEEMRCRQAAPTT